MRDEPAQRPGWLFDAGASFKPTRAPTVGTEGSRDKGVSGGRHLVPIGLGAVAFVLAVVLPLLRQTGAHSWRTVWAEDGTIYFQDAYTHGPLAVLFRGYAGYLQLPPRILGAASLLVPIGQLALFFALASAVVNALLAWFVFWASDGWITSRPARLALASLLILMPVLGTENTATITNTIWTFAAVAPWSLISLAERPRAVALRSLVAFLAATATALSAIFVPLALGYALIRRTRATWVVVATFCGGLLVQALVVLSTTDSRAFVVARQASKLPELVSLRVFAEYLLSDKPISWMWHDRRLLTVIAPLLVLTVLASRFGGATRRNQIAATALFALSLIFFVVPVWGRGTTTVGLSPAEVQNFLAPSKSTSYEAGNRFSVVPVATLAGAAGLLLAGSRRKTRSDRRIWPTVFVAHVALLTAIGFFVTNLRSHSPDWSHSVSRVYRSQCAEDPNKLALLPGTFGHPVKIVCRDLKG